MNRGLIQRIVAERLLTKYRVPMTPMSKVYKGEPVKKDEQDELFGGNW